MSEVAIQAVRDIALRELAKLPLTQTEWEGLAVLAVGLRSTGHVIEALRHIFDHAVNDRRADEGDYIRGPRQAEEDRRAAARCRAATAGALTALRQAARRPRARPSAQGSAE